MIFKVITPSLALQPFVKYYWIFDNEYLCPTEERAIPIGCMQLVFHQASSTFSSLNNSNQPQSFIEGHMSSFSDYIYTGETKIVAVIFQAQGAQALLSLPMSEFYNKNISIDDINDCSLKGLNEKIINTPNQQTCVEIIEKFLLKRLYASNYEIKRNQLIVQAIESFNFQNMDQLADIACFSYKQFKRVFLQQIGLNPKEFVRTVRFQRVIRELQVNPQTTLSTLAFNCGFSNEAHVLNEFKSFTGYSPKEYIGTCNPYSDYFIV